MAILRRSARGIGAMTAAVLVLTSGITGVAFADEPDSSPSVSEVSTQNVAVSQAQTEDPITQEIEDSDPVATLTKATPKIKGTAKVGKTLTAKKGKWTSSTSVSYQWYRNGKKISGATKATYKLKAADSGKKISVKATGKKTGYTTASKTSGKTKAVAKGTLSAAKPKISGSAKVGKTLKVKTGKWSPSSTKVSYQWKRNGKKISGAKKSSYKVKAADKGKRISVTVTGKASGYKTKSVTSGSTAVVKYPSSMYPSGWKCPSWAPIKGNASSMIYHVPGGAFYSRTNPEQCFASASAAKSAGYRASKR